MLKCPIKIVIAGDGGTGKSSFIAAKRDGKFSGSSKITIGIDVQCIPPNTGPESPSILAFDLGGQERFQFMHDLYLKGAKAGVVLYDLTRPKTFDNVPKWITLLQKEKPNLPIVVAGSKKDLVHPEDLGHYRTKWLCLKPTLEHSESILAHFFCSALTMEGVEEIFGQLIKVVPNFASQFVE
jgi:small GTP-binding protein